jgi:hypothetical protein
MGRLAEQERAAAGSSPRWSRSAGRWSRIHNLIRVYHVGIVGDKLYYTMDLADDHANAPSSPFDGLNCPMATAR